MSGGRGVPRLRFRAASAWSRAGPARSRRTYTEVAHAAWDAYHYRVSKVVARSLAEFCLVLDTIVAAVIVIVTATD